MTTALSDRVRITVPWNRADSLQARLRRLGFRTTLCLNPRARQAAIEVDPADDLAAVRRALDEPAGG